MFQWEIVAWFCCECKMQPNHGNRASVTNKQKKGALILSRENEVGGVALITDGELTFFFYSRLGEGDLCWSRDTPEGTWVKGNYLPDSLPKIWWKFTWMGREHCINSWKKIHWEISNMQKAQLSQEVPKLSLGKYKYKGKYHMCLSRTYTLPQVPT